MQDTTVAQSALAGVHTLQDGTGDRTTALGNLYVAAKISPQAVSPKSFQGESCDRERMLHPTQISMAKHAGGDSCHSALEVSTFLSLKAPTRSALDLAPALQFAEAQDAKFILACRNDKAQHARQHADQP